MGLSEVDPLHVMTKVEGKNSDYLALVWRCAGCGDIHNIPVVRQTARHDPSWKWNGDMVKPTLSPSIMKQPNKPNESFPGVEKRCHSFVKDGAVQFLGDCDHELAGQTVAMAPANADPWNS